MCRFVCVDGLLCTTYSDGLRPMPPTPDQDQDHADSPGPKQSVPSFKYRQGLLSIRQGRIHVLIKNCEDVEFILESCGISWRSSWCMCLPHRARGHALGAGLASRKHFASMFDTFGVHLGAYWTFWGAFWCRCGVILVSCW